MALKFTERPYGLEPERGAWDKYPRHARPISTAPEQSNQPVTIYNSDGVGAPAVFHRGLWMKTETLFDPYTAKNRTVMSGESIHDAVMWAPSL
jgi:hypothetical protein